MFSRYKVLIGQAGVSSSWSLTISNFQCLRSANQIRFGIHLSSGTLQYTNSKYLPDVPGVRVPGYISLSIFPSPMSSANQQEHGKNKGSSSSGMTSISSKKIPFPLPWVSCPTRILSTFKSGEKNHFFCRNSLSYIL